MKAKILKKFEDEVAELERELHLELPKEIQRARELGDLRENAEYQAAKDRQGIVNARIAMLKKRIAEISIMNLDKIPHDRAAFGSTVQLREDNGDSITYQLVMPEEADAAKGSSRPALRSAGPSSERPQATRSKSPRRTAPATSRSSSSSPSTTRRELFTTPENRRSAERQRYGRRLSCGRAARAARSRREGRRHERPRHRRSSAACSRRSTQRAKTWEDGGVWRRRPAVALYRWRAAAPAGLARSRAGRRLPSSPIPLLVLATALVAYPLQLSGADDQRGRRRAAGGGIRRHGRLGLCARQCCRPSFPGSSRSASRRRSACWRSSALRRENRGRLRHRRIAIAAAGGRGSSDRRGAPSPAFGTSGQRCGSCFVGRPSERADRCSS